MERKLKKPLMITLKYKIAHSEKFGRYLQAARDLAAGEVILREEPIVVGPMISCEDNLCFACLRLLPKIQKKAQYLCSKCNVAPLCDLKCEQEGKHHTQQECDIIKKNNDLMTANMTNLNNLLLPLRLWLLKEKDPELWKRVNSLEAHLDKRKDTAVWFDRETSIINVMKSLCFISEEDTSATEILQQLCSILDINSFELRTPGGLDGYLRGLYMEASFMAHDCLGNTHLTLDDNFQLTVHASIPIKENEPIFFNYTSPLLGTLGRREHLKKGKYFECDCSLCKDPYEMGSYMSSILCQKCREGYIGMQNPLTNFPYENFTKWQCEHCKNTINGRLVKATLNIVQTLIEDVNERDAKDLENLITKLSQCLHPNHYLMLALKHKLLAIYRKEIAVPNPQKKLMQKMLETCKELGNVLDIVEPGISRMKGIILYETHMPIVLLANCAYAAREISSMELASRLEESAAVLKKSLTMLLLEPAETPEGNLAKRALQELKALIQNMKDVKEILLFEHNRKCEKQRSQGNNKTNKEVKKKK